MNIDVKLSKLTLRCMYIQICNLCVNACIWNFKKKKCLSQPWDTALTKAVPNPPLLPCINLLT